MRVLLFLPLIAFLGFSGPASAASLVTVTRPVNLRRDPSSSRTPIRLLGVGETAELVDSLATNSYWHIRTYAAEDGWVWSKNVEVSSDELELGPTLTMLNPPAGVANSISATWDKPAPRTGTYTMATGAKCGPAGSPGSDAVTNPKKNRADGPTDDGFTPHAVSFAAVHALPDPHVKPRSRANWPQSDESTLESYEGAAIQLTGYIVAYKPQSGSVTKPGEACNCGGTVAPDLDVHIALAEKAGQGEAEAIVVETTPRIRKHHPNWSRGKLGPWIQTALPVRITGWLMYDPEHRTMVGTLRSSMWEIHPITQIEVWQDSSWVNADDLP